MMETPKVFESEYKFCLILWENEPIKSGNLVKLCKERLGWKSTTTYTVIKRLSERGVIKNENTIVSSIVSKEQIQEAEIVNMVEKTFEGSLPAFISAFGRHEKLSEKEIEDIRKSMPEMPQDRFVRYTEKYGLPTDDANLIISSKEFSDFYDESVKINPDYKQISNLMLVELNRNLNDSEKTISDVTFSPADLAELVKMSTDGVVSKNAAKDILKIMFNNGGKPIDIAKENGFIMDNDTSGLEEIIDKIIAENADSVESYKNGNQKIFGFLMGQVVRTAGKGANPKLAKDLLTEKLK